MPQLNRDETSWEECVGHPSCKGFRNGGVLENSFAYHEISLHEGNVED